MSYDHDNIFARIISGKVPAKRVYEDDQVLVIEDIAAAAPVHVLVLPKGQYSSFDDFAANAPAPAVAHFFKIITTLARQLGVEESGYRLITNHGAHASQSVPHFHVHLLAGTPLGGLLAGDESAR